MTLQHQRISRLCLALAAAFAAPAMAQQTAPAASGKPADEAKSEVTTLETVTVTARRREESLRDVPVAVTAMTEKALETLGVKDLGDLQGQVPNLTVYAARGSNTTVTSFIRGVGQADPLWGVDPGVGIYFDDVYVARPQGGLLDVFDVQRVEVLRGPQGTLYGKNTIGGAIKYVSRPLGKDTEGALSFAFGNYGQINLKAAAGAASADGQLRGRVALASLNHDGYGHNLVDGSAVSNQKTNAGRASFGFFPTGMPFNVLFSIDRTRDDSNMRGFQRMAVNSTWDPLKTPVPTSRYDITSGMANANFTHGGGQSLTATWNVSDAWTAKFISAYRSGDTATGIDFDGLPNKIADVRASYSDSQRSNELQFTYDAGGTQSGVFGLYQFDGKAGGTVLNAFLADTIFRSFGNTNGKVYTKSTAVYGDWNWRLTPDLGLTAGLRLTEESKRAVVLNQGFSDGTYTKVVATAADFDKTRKVHNTAPKLSMDYKFSSSTNLYATASRGFKSGGYNVRANQANPLTLKPFEDETLDSFELGSKMVLDGGRLELNAAAFHNKYKNVQLSVFSTVVINGAPTFLGDFTNAGKATVQGAELEFVWRPSSAWTVSGNLAALHAKYDEYMDKGVNVAKDKKFSNAPKFQGGLNLEHLSQPAFGGLLRARVGLSYRTKVYPTTDLSEIIAQDAYSLLSAGLIWERSKNLSFSLQGSNLTDKAYRTDGYNIPALGILSGYYGAPRTVTLGVQMKF